MNLDDFFTSAKKYCEARNQFWQDMQDLRFHSEGRARWNQFAAFIKVMSMDSQFESACDMLEEVMAVELENLHTEALSENREFDAHRRRAAERAARLEDANKALEEERERSRKAREDREKRKKEKAAMFETNRMNKLQKKLQ